jgi:transposase
MRGTDGRSGELFSYVDLEKRVPGKHPLRLVRKVVNDVLAALDGEFAKAYAQGGRPSIPPERLLRALLLQAFYTIRSERQLIEQLDYNLLYRWFVGLGVDDPVWVPTVFTKNRDRLLEADVARKFLAELIDHEELRGLLSDEHFSVDGTQIAAWASMKSYKAKDGSSDPPAPGRNGERDFHGEKRSNASHVSATDPEAQLYKKGPGKGSQAQLHRTRADGEPQRAHRRGNGDEGDRHRRTQGGREDDRAPFTGSPPYHRGRRQGLRRGFVHRRHARAQRDAAHRPEHQRPALRARRSHHAPS